MTPAVAGGRGDGIADDSAAFEQVMSLGRPIHLVGRRWRVASSIRTGRRDLTLIGPGMIIFPRSEGALVFDPQWGPSSAILDFAEEIYPGAIGSPVARLTLNDGSAFAAGDVVQVRSSDALATDPLTKRAELASVLDVRGRTVWLTQLLGDTYGDTPVLQRLPTQRLRLVGDIVFHCDQDLQAKGGNRDRAAIQIEGAVEPIVDVEIADAPTRGVFALSCWRGRFSVRARDLRDDVSDAAYGYGIALGGASRYNHVDVQAERCRHAFTTNVYAPLGPAWCGGPRDNRVTGAAVRCSSAGFDTHPACFDTHFQDIEVSSISADLSGSGPGERYAFQDRGIRTVVDGLTTYGFTAGLYSFASADPGFDYINRYSRILAVCGTREAAINGSQSGGVNFAGGPAAGRMTVEIYESLFDGAIMNWSTRAQRAKFFRSRFLNLDTMRTGNADVAFYDCQRDNETGRDQEPIEAFTDGNLLLVRMHFSGGYGGRFIDVRKHGDETNLVRNGNFRDPDLATWAAPDSLPRLDLPVGDALATIGHPGTHLCQQIEVVPGRAYRFTRAGTARLGIGLEPGTDTILPYGTTPSFCFESPSATLWINVDDEGGKTLGAITLSRILGLHTVYVSGDRPDHKLFEAKGATPVLSRKMQI